MLSLIISSTYLKLSSRTSPYDSSEEYESLSKDGVRLKFLFLI